MTSSSFSSVDVNTAMWSGFEGRYWMVHKFGGTSVASAECFRAVSKICQQQASATAYDEAQDATHPVHIAVVVSAMGGKPKVTDLLLDSVKYAAERNTAEVDRVLGLVLEKHETCLAALFPAEQKTRKSGSTTSRMLLDLISQDLHNIRDILKTVSLMKWPAQRISELVSGYGELWSTQILTKLLQQQQQRQRSSKQLQQQQHASSCHWVYVDARRVITIDEEAIHDGVVVWDVSQTKLDQVYREELLKLTTSSSSSSSSAVMNPRLNLVITGYVASNTDGVATTLQRDGSDYSAAIVGRLLTANSISIWTDVDGVLSADPRRVPLAIVLPQVSYNEAMELAYFGAKVIHPKTMQPAFASQPQIPIYIRNTFSPHLPGTRIFVTDTAETSPDDLVVCGFSSIENMALVNVEGSGMMGVPGVANRIFGTLERQGISVVLISQASSEHSITFCTVEHQAELAKAAMEEEFRRELQAQRISSVDVRKPCSIIAAVGDRMSHTTGVAGRFFSALGDAKINVHAIAQGSSERNISAVVWSRESTRALRAVHSAFHLSYMTVRVALLGMTAVGDSLLRLLETQRGFLRANFDIDVQVCVVLTTGSADEMISLKNDNEEGGNSDSITVGAYASLMGTTSDEKPRAVFQDEAKAAAVTKGGVEKVLDRLFRSECTSHAIFDCTNDETVGRYHAAWLRAGIDVVTANNTGLSGSKTQRDEIKQAERALGKESAKYLRQVTVAGGLPVLSTLRNLLNSGDKIFTVDGIFTVVLSYVMYRISPPPNVADCSEFDKNASNGAFKGDIETSSSSFVGTACSFSEAVREAIALGLTEEDPTTDLNNEYAARMLMVLARELRMDEDNETASIQHASDTLCDIDKEMDFLNLPPEIDQRVQERVDAAKSRGCVLRNISSIDVKSKKVEIKIVEVPEQHVFAVTPPSCSCVRFFTQRHMTYPLIVQGPSAGADSTASALLAELLQRARGMPSSRTLALSREGSGAFLQGT